MLYCYHTLPALAEEIPPVERYAIDMYGMEPSKPLGAMGDGTTAVVISARGGENG